MSNIFTIITNPKTFFINAISSNNKLRNAIIIWSISSMTSMIILSLSGFSGIERYILNYVSIDNMYLKMVIYLCESILSIILIATCINICAMIFKNKSNFYDILISYLHIGLLTIFLFPIYLILYLTNKLSWINFTIWLTGLIEFILLIIAVKVVYKIKSIAKAILIGIICLLFLIIFYLFVSIVSHYIVIDQYDKEDISTVPSTFICEITQKEYTTFQNNFYNIKGVVTVEVLEYNIKESSIIKDYSCSIVQDCIQAEINIYVKTYGEINLTKLQEYCITQTNQFLINHDLQISKLILEIE